jgi:hypothetical protein
VTGTVQLTIWPVAKKVKTGCVGAVGVAEGEVVEGEEVGDTVGEVGVEEGEEEGLAEGEEVGDTVGVVEGEEVIGGVGAVGTVVVGAKVNLGRTQRA